jgi:hypothetical protein
MTRLEAAAARMRDKMSADVEQLNKVADSLRVSSQIIAAANDVLSRKIADRAAMAASALQESGVSGSPAGQGADVVQLAAFRQAKKTRAKADRNGSDSA